MFHHFYFSCNIYVCINFLSFFQMPDAVVDYDLLNGKWTIVQQQNLLYERTRVLYGSSAAGNSSKRTSASKNIPVTDIEDDRAWNDLSEYYACEEYDVSSHDGVSIPLTILYSRHKKITGDNPGLLHGHGAYGEILDKRWRNELKSLLDRGWVIAYADVRFVIHIFRYIWLNFTYMSLCYRNFVNYNSFFYFQKYHFVFSELIQLELFSESFVKLLKDCFALNYYMICKGSGISDCFGDLNSRGGGGKGKKWFYDGRRTKKLNSVKDYISCAKFLIGREIVGETKLAGWGYSAGGLLVASAINFCPDLFRAAVLKVIQLNDNFFIIQFY